MGARLIPPARHARPGVPPAGVPPPQPPQLTQGRRGGLLVPDGTPAVRANRFGTSPPVQLGFAPQARYLSDAPAMHYVVLRAACWPSISEESEGGQQMGKQPDADVLADATPLALRQSLMHV